MMTDRKVEGTPRGVLSFPDLSGRYDKTKISVTDPTIISFTLYNKKVQLS